MSGPNVIRLPSACNRLARVDVALAAFRRKVEAQVARAEGGGDLGYGQFEQQLHELGRKLERAAQGDVLAATRPRSSRVVVDGVEYRRMAEEKTGEYLGLYGAIAVERHLYRQVGVRNGPTIDPIALRCGLVEGRMTPAAAVAFGHVGQAACWREGADICKSLGVLPYSRSTLQRNGLVVGAVWDNQCPELEDQLLAEFKVPKKAATLSVSVDRVSIPMAEDREPTALDLERGVENPISVVKRMAYCGVWTLHDAEGKPLHSVRYAYAPSRGSGALEVSLREDVRALLAKRPHLRVVALADGAPEMQNILDRSLAGIKVEAKLIDFWHLLQKLSEAAASTGRDAKHVASRFAEQLKGSDGAIEDIHSELLDWADATVGEFGGLPEELYAALTYIENNGDRMRYASIRNRRLPIGSGHVEATCKTIVSVRFKRSGARWRPEGTQSILGLRALATSSRWTPAMRLLTASYAQQVREAA